MKDAEFTPIPLQDFVPYRLNVVAEASSRSLAQCYQTRYGISVAEWRVLTTLYHLAPLSAQEVGEQTNQDKTRVSRAIKSLLAMQCIERTWCSEDRRKSVLCLTPQGQKLYLEAAVEAQQWQQKLERGLGPQKMALLLDLLADLEGTLGGFEDAVSAAPDDDKKP